MPACGLALVNDDPTDRPRLIAKGDYQILVTKLCDTIPRLALAVAPRNQRPCRAEFRMLPGVLPDSNADVHTALC